MANRNLFPSLKGLESNLSELGFTGFKDIILKYHIWFFGSCYAKLLATLTK
ncbi:hypothetical protein NIES19_38180 [Anabaena cylindrica PCC 7122]|nr:hypothetical protein NIES19_38180 [Anabaena cylindrica PCC 7122]